jgi:polar amino acid transport system permease protein
LFLHYLTLGKLLNGAVIALWIAGLAFAGGLALAVPLALLRTNRIPPVRWLVAAYLWVFRGTPLLLQLIFLYNVLPNTGIRLSAVQTAILGLALNEAAFVSEILRGGLLSVKPQQLDAAAALGLSPARTFRRVQLPQAMRVIVPALGNQAIVLIKDTSLASVIAVNELLLRSQQIVSTNFRYLPVFGATAVIYLVVTSVVVVAQRYLERRLDPDRAVRPTTLPVPTHALDGGIPLRSLPEGTPAMKVVDVTRAVGAKEILRGVDLTVEDGEVVCILGASGSGKSSLLRVITHLDAVDGGRIEVGGAVVGYRELGDRLVPVRSGRALAKARAAAHLGIVFQQFNLFDHLTVLENLVEAPLHVQGRRRNDVAQEAHQLLQRVGLDGLERRRPHQLSGGQQQRVAIIRALMTRPAVLLLDEPTSALDPELKGEVLDLVGELARAGMTLVIVTHEVEFARTCANRVVVMDDGVVIEDGPPDRVLTTPAQPRTKQLLRALDGRPASAIPALSQLDPLS